MRVCIISDLHGVLPELPECDLLLLAGDLAPISNHAVGFQRQWFVEQFAPWLDSVQAEETVWIAGNHDFVAEQDPGFLALAETLPGHFLQDTSVEVLGLKVHGSPWQPWFHDWAFNLRTEDELAEKWALIPDDTDILLAHGPPKGLGDKSLRDGCVGSSSQLERIIELSQKQLKLVACGHIHEAYGTYRLPDTQCQVINGSHMTLQYKPLNPPILIDL